MGKRARLAAIEARLNALNTEAGDADFTPEQQTEWDALLEERGALPDGETPGRGLLEEIRLEDERTAQRRAFVADLAARGNAEPGTGFGAPQVARKVDPYDKDPLSLTRTEARDRAMARIEKDPLINDRNKAHLETLFRRIDEDDEGGIQYDGSYVARRTLITERPEYRKAFKKYVRWKGLAALTPEESRAVAEYQALETRAASEGTNSAGGYGVPVYIDPSIILTSGAADAPILRVARRVPVTTNIWKGVSSAGMVWSYDAEASEVSDDAATLAQPSVTVYTPRGFLPYSFEVEMDYPGFLTEMGGLLDQGYTDLIAAQSCTGSGSSSPRGIFTATAANTNVQVVTTTDGSFGAPDVFKTWNALPERYRSRATWVMSVSVESAIRQFATNANAAAYFTVDLTADGISRINGRPTIVTDYAPSFTGSVPGTTGAANILVVGDFSNYLIAERAGMSIEFIQNLVGSNRRPTGQRGMFAWARHGMDSVNDLGFRILQNQ